MNLLRHIKYLTLIVPDGTAGQKSSVPPMLMCFFRPRLADTFEKPKTAGRKTSFRIKQKALAPEILEHCLDRSSKRQACDDNLNAPS